MKLKQWIVMLCAMGAALPLQAHDVEEKPTGPWSGSFALGYLASSGNTDDSSLTVDFTTGYDLDAWHHLLKGKTFSSRADNESTAESYQAGWKTSYDLDTNDYLFGALDWYKDRFSSYTRQTFLTAGYGRRILNSKRFVLNVEVGAGYAKQRAIVSETEFETLKENQDGALVSLGGNFTWNISDTATFGQSLTVFQTSDNTRTESVSSLTVGIIGSVGLELKYTVQNNSDVAPGLDKTDTYTSIGVKYSF